MKPKNTYKILGPIEMNIVARLTYEKKAIVTAEDMDRLFNLLPEDLYFLQHSILQRNFLKLIA